MINDPLATIEQNHIYVRVGILVFLITVVFDVVVAWALYELIKENSLSDLSMLFRMMHAASMGVAIFSLLPVLVSVTSEGVLHLVDTFNTIWLIGLFFFGIHLIIVGNIIGKPIIISFFIVLAGTMYMVDTSAHFTLPD